MAWKSTAIGLIALGAVVGALPGATSEAQARGGCGLGFHPSRFGICRPNGPRFGVFGPRGYGPRYGRPVIRERYVGPRGYRRDF